METNLNTLEHLPEDVQQWVRNEGLTDEELLAVQKFWDGIDLGDLKTEKISELFKAIMAKDVTESIAPLHAIASRWEHLLTNTTSPNYRKQIEVSMGTEPHKYHDSDHKALRRAQVARQAGLTDEQAQIGLNTVGLIKETALKPLMEKHLIKREPRQRTTPGFGKRIMDALKPKPRKREFPG
ncbi:MAG: hypothetical protein ACD_28C00161G0005 [uncultured bacterium]|nr:MAG: hypothetical protein ACD_28C00161G0005 [uncultured bacterium]KKT75030.1 MAG: hypothetical protein UW70_C0040G0005 [Candidatus Peregrinibacteria bacterium GW2011_GWA2_44_7]